MWIASDETWLGGKPRNQSKAKRAERTKGWAAYYGKKTEKPSILALVETESGEVRSALIPDVTGATLRKAIADKADLATTTLVTEEWQAYKPLAAELPSHETVNHSRDEYVSRSGFTTNDAERYFGQLKRSIDGTHHFVSREHLHGYLAQFRLHDDAPRRDRLLAPTHSHGADRRASAHLQATVARWSMTVVNGRVPGQEAT